MVQLNWFAPLAAVQSTLAEETEDITMLDETPDLIERAQENRQERRRNSTGTNEEMPWDFHLLSKEEIASSFGQFDSFVNKVKLKLEAESDPKSFFSSIASIFEIDKWNNN